MNRRPNLLPEENNNPRDTKPNLKNRSKRRRGAWAMMWLALLLLSLGFFMQLMIILYRPHWLGLETQADVELTEVGVRSTVDSLQGTSQALFAMADALDGTAQFNAQRSFSNESTQAALDNREMLFNQLATQAVVDGQATQTNIALSNAQQATQAAVEFQNTQTAFDRVATQVELDYQGTQAALNRDATAAALGFATNAPSSEDILSQTPPPTLTAQPLFTDRFETGVSSLWDFSSVEDWSLNTQGDLIAARSGAWLLSQQDNFSGYILEADFVPLQGEGYAANYHLLLNVQAEPTMPNGIALRISYDGSRVTAVGLHEFALPDLFEGDGLLNRSLPTLRADQVNLPPNAQISVRAEIRDSQIVVVIDGQLVLTVALDAVPLPGAVGLQVPAAGGVARVAVLP